ncbi:MerR family transcriptional regulator [Aquibium microcysteis]|uniref:MerR family transcriptional regulator n=1 Tax=Aquibium microcysteis TaxID=675281 RepID=UPI001EF305A7|nr:MerR family transcriptional regulator [Aquibium microcysteis]
MTAVCRLTGLNASTLRTWERRYGVPAPERSEGNRRRYSAGEVDRLVAIATLLGRGHAITTLAGMSFTALLDLVAKGEAESTENAAAQALYRRAVESLENRDFVGFRARLVEALTLLSPLDAIESVFAPLLRHMGEAWSRGDLPVHAEHLASAIMRQVVSIAAATRTPAELHVRLLFSTLAGDRHELGAIFAWYLALAAGHDALYLGPDLDVDEIVAGAEALDVDVVVLSVTTDATGLDVARERLERLGASLGNRRELWIGSSPALSVNREADEQAIRTFHDYSSFAGALSDVRERRRRPRSA